MAKPKKVGKNRNLQLTPWQRALLGHVICTANERGYFTVRDLYNEAEPHLQAMYPCNKNIRANIRDELQNLRDRFNLVDCLHGAGFWKLMKKVAPCCKGGPDICCRKR